LPIKEELLPGFWLGEENSEYERGKTRLVGAAVPGQELSISGLFQGQRRPVLLNKLLNVVDFS